MGRFDWTQSEGPILHLKDLKKCRNSAMFFDLFLDLEGYYQHEQRHQQLLLKQYLKRSQGLELADDNEDEWIVFIDELYHKLTRNSGQQETIEFDSD